MFTIRVDKECTHTRIYRSFSFQLTQPIKATIDARKTIIHLKKYNSIELTIVRGVWLCTRADRYRMRIVGAAVVLEASVSQAWPLCHAENMVATC